MSYGYRLLEWRQSLQRVLTPICHSVTVHVALGHVPHELFPGLPKWIQDAWRAHERQRINPEKPFALPWADEDWHTKVREQYARREAFLWRPICIKPATQTSDEVFFQLVLILLQERMVPQAETETLRATMVKHLCMREGMDAGTALLVLERLLSHFVEPTHAHGVKSYSKSHRSWTKGYLSEDGHKVKPAVFDTRRVTGEGGLIAVDDALVQFVAEGLPATRPTLFRWARDWALEQPDFAVRKGKRLWLTCAGMTEARTWLQWRAITKHQLDVMHKKPEATWKFTSRYRTRDKKPPEEAFKALRSPLVGSKGSRQQRGATL
jgi:hypothetical protein